MSFLVTCGQSGSAAAALFIKVRANGWQSLLEEACVLSGNMGERGPLQCLA